MIPKSIILFMIGCLLSWVVYQIDDIKPNPIHATPTSDYKRIISFSPALTEMIYALGAGEKIVAVSEYCRYPAATLSKPKVGAFLNPSYEKIVAFKPDLILIQGVNERLFEFCSKNNIKHLKSNLHNIESIYATINVLGNALNCSEKAHNLVERLQSGLNQIRKKVHNLPRRKVFLCFNRPKGSINNLYTLNANGFLGEVIKIAGGENIYADALIDYPEISKESLIQRSPEIIIEVRNDNLSEHDLLRDWQRLKSIPAVINKKIYVTSENYILIPGPRITFTAARFCELLYPHL